MTRSMPSGKRLNSATFEQVAGVWENRDEGGLMINFVLALPPSSNRARTHPIKQDPLSDLAIFQRPRDGSGLAHPMRLCDRSRKGERELESMASSVSRSCWSRTNLAGSSRSH